MATATKRCQLLQLPAELRNKIWEDVYEGNVHEVNTVGNTTTGNTGLLFTCKQVHAEAIEIYYAKTAFLVQAGLSSWLENMQTHDREVISWTTKSTLPQPIPEPGPIATTGYADFERRIRIARSVVKNTANVASIRLSTLDLLQIKSAFAVRPQTVIQATGRPLKAWREDGKGGWVPDNSVEHGWGYMTVFNGVPDLISYQGRAAF